MGHKRKRNSDATTAAVDDDSTENPSKVRAVEDTATGKPTLSGKEAKKKEKISRKQLRSERRAKKGEKSRQNALRNMQAKAEEMAAASVNANGDGIAGGEDFVPLTPEAALEIIKREKKEKKKQTQKKSSRTGPGTARRASPRSIRKAAQTAKALSLTTEEYGEDIFHEAEHGTATTGSRSADAHSNTTPRFICFVGNLPYTCTTAQLEDHFRKLEPKSIRHPTDKASGLSKGFAFLEFHTYDKMKTCLRFYHHSLFEPERTAQRHAEAGAHAADLLPRIADKKNKGRIINVQLTAGGGGKGNDRQKKILEKNFKLEKERAKTREKAIKKQKAEAKKARKAADGAATGANGVAVLGIEDDADPRGDVHPSRMSRVKA